MSAQDLSDLTVDVERVVIMLEAAKERLLNRGYPSDRADVVAYYDEVDAQLEVCSAYLRWTLAEMKAIGARPHAQSTKTA